MATAEVADARAALQRAEAEVTDAKADVTDAKAAVQRAEAALQRAEALAASNVAYIGIYASAQNAYAAAEHGYAAAQQTLQTAMHMQRVIALSASGSGGSVLNVSGVTHVSDEQVLSSLLEHYGRAATASRTASTMPPERDLGQEFEIKGRDRTYQVLLQGSAAMFSRFLRPGFSLEGYRRAQPFIFAMVAFPGAGKTTLGTRAWGIWKQHWRSLSDDERRGMLSTLLYDDEDYQRYVKMCNDSLHYNLCMYHLVANSEGGLFEAESGLNPGQILALRSLAAIVAPVETYSGFLRKFEQQCPGVKRHLTFKVVLKFLRAILPDLKEETELLVPFFYDEVNAITRDLKGELVIINGALQPGRATWMQSVLSSYIGEQWELAKSFEEIKVFPIVSIATTRFSAGELRFTESSKTEALAVPFPPLATKQCEEIVFKLLQNWAICLQEEAPKELTKSVKTLVRLSGGMPRALARAIEAIAPVNYEPTDWVKRTILQQCITDLKLGSLQHVIDRWTLEMDFNRYLREDTKPVLLRVLLRSLTATTVMRDMCVVETGNLSHIKYTDLEDAGLIALNVPPATGHEFREVQEGAQLMEVDDAWNERHVLSLDLYTTSSLGWVPVLVRCIPLVVNSLLKSGSLGVDVPDLLTTDHKRKEADDLAGVLLRIYLLDVSENRQEFTLQEILPPGSIIPEVLVREKFRLHKRCYRAERWNHRGSWKVMLDSYPETVAFLGPGNDGADSLLLLEKVNRLRHVAKELFYLVLQSKQVQSDRTEGFTPLLRNYYKDLFHLGVKLHGFDIENLGKVLNKGDDTDKLEEMVYKLPEHVGDFAYVYCSNMNYTEYHIDKVKRAKLGPKLIVAYEKIGAEYEDASNLLGTIRTFSRPFDLVRH